MRRAVLLLCFVVGWSLALVRAYTVEPKTQSMSGWTGRGDTVGQVLACCWDELDSTCYVELFVGSSEAGGENYNLEVLDAATESLIAYKYNVAPSGSYRWQLFEHLTPARTFTKGKQYEFIFTRSGSDSINYYTNIGTVYPYGYLKTGGACAPGARA
jgi:hypothetical protein